MNEILKSDYSTKANEQYFPIWCCLLCLVLLNSESVDKFQMGATKQHFPVVLFIMLYKMVLTLRVWDGILKCLNSNESNGIAFSVLQKESLHNFTYWEEKSSGKWHRATCSCSFSSIFSISSVFLLSFSSFSLSFSCLPRLRKK